MMRVIKADDFTGGLNLEANVFQLAPNQSPEMLNVDINQRGGVQRRSGCLRRNTTAVPGVTPGMFYPQRLFPWQAEQGNKLMLATDTSVFYSTTDNFTDLGVTSDATNGAEFASWTTGALSYLYMTLGYTYAPRKWDATTLTTLTASGTGQWQNDLTTPTGTHMPRAQHIAVHQDRVWVANTKEDSTEHPNRVRFSHPLFPESWRQDDYIDVVGGGAGITGIVPFAGHLVVFKPRAVYAIYGYNDDTFQLVELTREVGAANGKAFAVSDFGIYFFSFPEGVYFYDGKGIRDVFKNIRPMIYTAEINQFAINNISMGYANKKLFVSVPAGVLYPELSLMYDDSSTTYSDRDLTYDGSMRESRPRLSFVLNETVGREGAWTLYRTSDGYGFVSPVTFTDSSGRTSYVAAHPTQRCAFDFDVYELHTDQFLGAASNYQSYYVTPWLDAGNYVTKKFWRRPEFVFRREREEVQLTVYVRQDWDAMLSTKYYTLTAPASEVLTTSQDSWNPPELGAQVVKGDSLGYARSVQLKIVGTQGKPWCINSVAYKYNPRGTRP